MRKRPEPQSVMCPQCGRISFHPMDVKWRFCGACHKFHDQMPYEAPKPMHDPIP